MLLLLLLLLLVVVTLPFVVGVVDELGGALVPLAFAADAGGGGAEGAAKRGFTQACEGERKSSRSDEFMKGFMAVTVGAAPPP